MRPYDMNGWFAPPWHAHGWIRAPLAAFTFGSLRVQGMAVLRLLRVEAPVLSRARRGGRGLVASLDRVACEDR